MPPILEATTVNDFHRDSLARNAMTRQPTFEVISNNAIVTDTMPIERDPAQWHQAIGVARHVCARIFRDGGKPADAVATFGVTAPAADALDWSRAVDLIAACLCQTPARRAA